MPFIDTPIEHHFPWYVRLFFWNQKWRYGAVLEPARLWGRSPRVFAALAEFETSTRFSEREKAALSYAEAMTYSDSQPTAMHFERLGAQFDDDAIIELIALIAFQNLSSKFNASPGLEAQGFCSTAPQTKIDVRR